jgi:hypothetical protein
MRINLNLISEVMSGTDPARNKLKVVFLQDNLDDVELELREMRKGQFQVEYDVARNRMEFMEEGRALFP